MDETHTRYIFRTRRQQYHQQTARFLWYLFWQLRHILISMWFQQFVALQMLWIVHRLLTMKVFSQLLEGFGILEEKDMIEMVKCLGGHSYNCGRTREDWSNSGEEIASSLLLGT
jgi:hypothetical protein